MLLYHLDEHVQSIVHMRYVAAFAAQNRQLVFQLKLIIATSELIRSATKVPIYVWYNRILRSPYGTLLRGETRLSVLRQFGLECTLMAETFGRLLDLRSFPALVDIGSSEQLVQGDWRQHLGHREKCLKQLVSEHSDMDELALATRIAERTT